MKKINKQAGFTLIELIMVIVILGVLSAFALPRFADLGGDAREASINGLNGAIKSAANIAHAQWLADGGTATTVSLEGTSITMINGYPIANTAGIEAAAQLSASLTGVGTDYISTAGGNTGGDTVTYSLQTNCQVVYTSATTTTSASAVATVTGC
jgi:MSHA pilin protein MshA